MNDVTKNLQKLVKKKHIKTVVIETGSVKKYPKKSRSSSTDYYSSGGYYG